MSQPIITVENLSKRYRKGAIDSASLRHELANHLRRMFGRDVPADAADFWALKDVSFEVQPGEVIGILGSNGAGKSTLLKILSRITAPSGGYAELRGRVASMLEVGTGFHPELTGRENIYLNGAIFGMSKGEIAAKFEEIVEFSGVGGFIDTPVKRYSSGMYVRLAFAVAAHLSAEIMLVDEVLAVGDAEFQKKCLDKIGSVTRHGRTVLLVSHNMGSISALCNRVLWLDKGRLVESGPTEGLIKKYLNNNYSGCSYVAYDRKPDRTAQIIGIRLLDESGHESVHLTSGSSPVVELHYSINRKLIGMHAALIIGTDNGTHLFSTADSDLSPELLGAREPGDYKAHIRLPMERFNTGAYLVTAGLGIPGGEVFDRREAIRFIIHDTGDSGSMKEGSRRAGLILVDAPWTYIKS